MANFRTKMERYYFVDTKTNKIFIKPRWFGKSYCLCGIVQGRTDLAPNTVICTGEVIRSLSTTTIRTNDFSEYELGEMHEDYADFLSAIRRKIPVLTNWHIENFNGKYMMYADEGKNIIAGEIISQEGNYVTLDSGIKYFVMWSDINEEKMISIPHKESKLYKLGYSENFTHFAHKICRPILFK